MVSDPSLFVIGNEVTDQGYVTKLVNVGARSARSLEQSLGYGEGRLSAGWAVLLLIGSLSPEDFEFEGLTIRSGGRLGLPDKDPIKDDARRRVHTDVMEREGPAQYCRMQESALSTITPEGDQRLVRVRPVTRHSDSVRPDEQYPMGGGGLQWKLVKPRRFLVGMVVDAHCIARIPGFSTVLNEGTRYDDRAKLMRHLLTA